jgi:hypothetical protein
MITMEEWYDERVLGPKRKKKQEWERVSRQAKETKLRNRMSKRDIEREVRIESLGGKPIEIRYGVPLSEEKRKERLEIEWDLKYPKRKEKRVKVKPKGKVKGAARTKNQFVTSVLRSIKARAIKRGLPFDLTEADMVIPEVCPVLGIPLSWGNGLQDSTPSVDRVKPELGYVKSNCKIISMKANRLKSNATVEQFKAIVAYLEGEI